MQPSTPQSHPLPDTVTPARARDCSYLCDFPVIYGKLFFKSNHKILESNRNVSNQIFTFLNRIIKMVQITI